MPKYGVFSGPYFPAFGLNTAFSPNVGKYGPEKNSVFGHFSHSDELNEQSRQCPWCRHFPRWKNHEEKGTEQTKYKQR